MHTYIHTYIHTYASQYVQGTGNNGAVRNLYYTVSTGTDVYPAWYYVQLMRSNYTANKRTATCKWLHTNFIWPYDL